MRCHHHENQINPVARQTRFEFQHAGSERAGQDFEQAARDVVHVAVAQATAMFSAEMRKRTSALESQAEQTWTSYQVT